MADSKSPVLEARGFHFKRRARFAMARQIESMMYGPTRDAIILPTYTERHDKIVVKHVVCDLHGTVAVNGTIDPVIPPLFHELEKKGVKVHILTADADGKAAELCKAIPLKPSIIKGENPSQEKLKYVEALGGGIVYIGNGASDYRAAAIAAVSFGVCSEEGQSGLMTAICDLNFNSVVDALTTVLDPRRFKSGCQC